METIVIYNLGQDAAKQGLPRSLPNIIEYPVTSRYHEPRKEIVYMDIQHKHVKDTWLAGYDSWKNIVAHYKSIVR